MLFRSQPSSLASSGWLMLCSFIKSARRMLDGAGRYSCAMWSALLLEFFLIIVRSAVLFNIRFPLCPCCCNSATSKGFFLFPLQFCRFFALSAKFSVYSGTRQKNTRVPTLGYSGAVHNIALPGGRRVRGFVGIEPLVHPCP